MTKSIKLSLPELDALFQSQPDPFRPSYSPHPRIEALIDEAKALPVNTTLRIELHVSHAEITQGLLPLADAVRQFCDQEIHRELASLDRIRRDGTASLLRGLIFLSASFALSTAFAAVEVRSTLLHHLFTEGMVIAGWVALWGPFEMLMFNRAPHKSRIRALQMLRKAEWEVTLPSNDPL